MSALSKLSVLALLFFVSHSVFAGELVLVAQLTRELNETLKAGDRLHKSIVEKDDEQIEIRTRDLIHQLDRAKQVSHLAKAHERAHLIRILDAARENFEISQSTFGADRRDRLEEGYNQLVNLVRIYKVDRSYSIFFCPKDKSTWVQTGSKPQNPFRSEAGVREPCGIKVPK